MEKCILFISELPEDQRGLSFPVGLSNIYSTAQRMNAAFGITGFFTFRSGHYLEVIEGEDIHIDQLYRNILSDGRHRNLVTVIDTEIEQRSFQSWNMSLIVPASSNPEFLHFVDRMTSHLKAIPNSHLKLFGIFFPTFLMPIGGTTASGAVADMRPEPATDMDPQAGSESARVEYKKWVYRLTGWPSFNGIEVSAAMLSICALLVKQRSTYQSLLESEPDLVPEELDDILATFNQTGMLRISAPDHATPAHPDLSSSGQNRPKSGRGSRGFLNKLKGLIGTGTD